MQTLLLHETNLLIRRREKATGCGLSGCLVGVILFVAVLYVVLRGRKDRPEQLAAAKRPLSSGPVELKTFANPFAKCPNCGGAASKMRQNYDGFRSVTWTCGYCGHAQVQELQDHELPPQVRQRLGLDPRPGVGLQRSDWNEPMGPSPLGGAGGLLTGMMLGSMLGGGLGPGAESRNPGSEDWPSEDAPSDWGEGDSSGDWGDSGSDWGDSGGDFGGGDDW